MIQANIAKYSSINFIIAKANLELFQAWAISFYESTVTTTLKFLQL